MLEPLARVQLLYNKIEQSTWQTVKHYTSESDHETDNNNSILKLYISYLCTLEKHPPYFGSCAGKFEIYTCSFLCFSEVKYFKN